MSRQIDGRLSNHRSIFAAGLVGIVGMLAAGAAQATTYTVDTLNDSSGASDCSLRDAINAADGSPTGGSTCTATPSGNDTINISVTGKISLNSLLPQIADSSLTIDGPMTSPGITIDGGGGLRVLFLAKGTLNLNDLTIANGGGSDFGAGINNPFDGKLNITNCTFSGNSANLRGGAIESDAGSTLNVTNSSFYNNIATTGSAIYDAGSLNVTNSTFSGNIANNEDGGGISVGVDGTANIKGTILAGNSGQNCLIDGTLNDDGYNISDDSTCGFSKTGAANNGDNVNPMLAALASNGGPTMTFALQSGSPAIDTIPPDACTYLAGPNPCTTSGSITNQLTCDQRGFIRPALGQENCDIGAVEGVAAPALGAPGVTCQDECIAQGESCTIGAFDSDITCAIRCRSIFDEPCMQSCDRSFVRSSKQCSSVEKGCNARCAERLPRLFDTLNARSG